MLSRPRRDPVGPGQESVWDYPRPPALVPCDARVTVRHGGIVVADSSRAWRILETAHAPAYYVPAEDVRTDLLAASRTTSVCEFKGRAAYADLLVPGHPAVRDACWWFPQPSAPYVAMAGAICFYPQRVDECCRRRRGGRSPGEPVLRRLADQPDRRPLEGLPRDRVVVTGQRRLAVIQSAPKPTMSAASKSSASAPPTRPTFARPVARNSRRMIAK